MKDIVELAETAKKLGLEWMELASRHSVAQNQVLADRNELSGKVYVARKAFNAALLDMCKFAHEMHSIIGIPDNLLEEKNLLDL